MSVHPQYRYRKIDFFIALLMAILVFFVSFYGTSNLPSWGDDFAAYFNDAIAITEGSSEEQHRLNNLYHPSKLPSEATDGTLRYVWGYSLLLSFVYRLVGFDRVQYDSLIYYKLVSVICFALCASVMLLFFRRRFSLPASVLFTVFVGTNYLILRELGSLYADITYMFFSMLSLALAELFLSVKTTRSRLIAGAFLGIAMWYTHEVRLNGLLTVVAVSFLLALHLLRNRKAYTVRMFAVQFFPFALFLILTFVSERWFLWKPTSNMSDFSTVSLHRFFDMANYYYYTVRDWIASSLFFGLFRYPIPRICKIFAFAVLLLCLIGLLNCLRKKDVSATVYAGLIVVFFTGASLLPYQQGVRYIFPLMPLALLFIGYGAQAVSGFVKRLCEKRKPLSPRFKKRSQRLAQALMCCYCIAMLVMAARSIKNYEYLYETAYDGPYTEDSIEMYRYIRENTEETALIITGKPRVLYLNTERKTIPFENGHTVEEADYYLRNVNSRLTDHVLAGVVTKAQLAEMTEVYRTEHLILYRVGE